MPVIHREWDVCPYCHRRIGDVRSTFRGTIGPEVAKCPHCSGIYKTGQSEWASKSKGGRSLHYLQTIAGIVGAAFIGAVWVFGTALVIGVLNLSLSKGQTNGIALGVGCGVFVVGAALILLGSRAEIRRSLERTQRASESESPLSLPPSPRQRVDKSKIRWCHNCSHYRQVDEYEDIEKGLWLSRSKPRNDKLPCDISGETEVVWKRHFKRGDDTRTWFPKDCEAFERRVE